MCCVPGELKAVTVLRAFQRQAASEDEKYNFVTEPLDPESTEVSNSLIQYH